MFWIRWFWPLLRTSPPYLPVPCPAINPVHTQAPISSANPHPSAPSSLSSVSYQPPLVQFSPTSPLHLLEFFTHTHTHTLGLVWAAAGFPFPLPSLCVNLSSLPLVQNCFYLAATLREKLNEPATPAAAGALPVYCLPAIRGHGSFVKKHMPSVIFPRIIPLC